MSDPQDAVPKIHSKVKEEEKPKSREQESPLVYSTCVFFFTKVCCDPGVEVRGESWTPKGDQGPQGHLLPAVQDWVGRWLGAHFSTRKGHVPSLSCYSENSTLEEALHVKEPLLTQVSPSLI